MKLGFFTMPMHSPGRNYTQKFVKDSVRSSGQNFA
jgi:hypothetical protein